MPKLELELFDELLVCRAAMAPRVQLAPAPRAATARQQLELLSLPTELEDAGPLGALVTASCPAHVEVEDFPYPLESSEEEPNESPGPSPAGEQKPQIAGAPHSHSQPVLNAFVNAILQGIPSSTAASQPQ
jgi:hypothetical protein